jgi:hypothetical protein
VAATCCQPFSVSVVVEVREGDTVGNASTAKRTAFGPFMAKNQPPLLLSLSMMRPPLPPPAERGLIQAETLIPCRYRLARLPAPDADTYPLPPLAKFRAVPDSPEVQEGELTRVPVLPDPEASAAVVPVPSFRFQ